MPTRPRRRGGGRRRRVKLLNRTPSPGSAPLRRQTQRGPQSGPRTAQVRALCRASRGPGGRLGEVRPEGHGQRLGPGGLPAGPGAGPVPRSGRSGRWARPMGTGRPFGRGEGTRPASPLPRTRAVNSRGQPGVSGAALAARYPGKASLGAAPGSVGPRATRWTETAKFRREAASFIRVELAVWGDGAWGSQM